MSNITMYNPKDFTSGSIVEIDRTGCFAGQAAYQFQIESLKRTSKSSCDFLVQMRAILTDKDTGLVTISDTLDEYNPYWISKTIKQGTGGVKWSFNYINPGLYTAGTLVRARNLPGSFGNEELKNKIYTVKGLFRSGAGSYCIVTTESNPCKSIGGNESFNLTWVTEIVKRGQGKTVWLNDRHTTLPSPYVKQAFFFVPKIKNSHVVYVLEDAVMQSLWFRDQSELYVDLDKLTLQLSGQSWVRRLEYRQVGEVFIVNKKRLKRWLEQNLNRFRSKKALAIAEYDQLMQESFSDSDYDWGDHGE